MSNNNVPNFETLRAEFIPANTTSSVTNIKQKKEPEIMNQMIAYDAEVTDIFVQQIEEELKEQRDINVILNQGNYEQNQEEIDEFVNTYKDQISNQLTTLETTFSRLKEIVEQNGNLYQQQREYRETTEKAATEQVARELKQLKQLKNKVLVFLQKNGLE